MTNFLLVLFVHESKDSKSTESQPFEVKENQLFSIFLSVVQHSKEV